MSVHYGTPRPPVDTIKITCSCENLNLTLDERNDGQTITIRNAGANIPSISVELEKLLGSNSEIRRIVLELHTNCMLTEKVLIPSGKANIDPRLYTEFVEQYGQTKFKGRIEGTLLKFQFNALQEFLKSERTIAVTGEKKLNIIARVLDTPARSITPSSIIITRPNLSLVSDILDDVNWASRRSIKSEDAYFVQPVHLPSIALAASLSSIKDIIVLARNDDEELDSRRAERMIQEQNLFTNTKVSLITPKAVRRRMSA